MKKRSEFERESEKYWMKAQEDGVVLGGTIRCLVLRDVYAAERAGVVWDPEKTEVVWRSGSIRLNAYGSWEVDYSGSDRWTKMEVSNTFAPVYAELARRLLAEKESVLNLDCDGPIIPRELADHPAFRAVWAVIEGWSNPIPTGARVLKILRALRDAGVTIPAKREHVTDGSPCWCNPVTERPDAVGKILDEIDQEKASLGLPDRFGGMSVKETILLRLRVFGAELARLDRRLILLEESHGRCIAELERKLSGIKTAK